MNPAAESSTQDTPESARFVGKVAVITGASDRGIGGEIAVRLAREGAAVSLISRTVPQRLLKKVNRFEHGAIHTAGDVTKADDVKRAIDDCMGEFGKIDIVVNNAGLIGFTQSLAWELAPKGIRVVAVAPGLVHTPMIHKHVSQLTPEIWAKIEACHPLGMGRPDDVAAAVAFLASSDARWITGIT